MSYYSSKFQEPLGHTEDLELITAVSPLKMSSISLSFSLAATVMVTHPMMSSNSKRYCWSETEAVSVTIILYTSLEPYQTADVFSSLHTGTSVRKVTEV